MKKVYLILSVIMIYLLVNLAVIYYISSYGYALSVFRASKHYQTVKHYQNAWDVPIWVGEFCWEKQVRLPTVLIQAWLRATRFRYMLEDSMVKLFDNERWSWCYWEYEKGAYQDEMENTFYSKHMKGNWKPSEPIPKLVVRNKEIQTEDGKPILLKGGNLPLKHLAFYSNLKATEETFKKLDGNEPCKDYNGPISPDT